MNLAGRNRPGAPLFLTESKLAITATLTNCHLGIEAIQRLPYNALAMCCSHACNFTMYCIEWTIRTVETCSLCLAEWLRRDAYGTPLLSFSFIHLHICCLE